MCVGPVRLIIRLFRSEERDGQSTTEIFHLCWDSNSHPANYDRTATTTARPHRSRIFQVLKKKIHLALTGWKSCAAVHG